VGILPTMLGTRLSRCFALQPGKGTGNLTYISSDRSAYGHFIRREVSRRSLWPITPGTVYLVIYLVFHKFSVNVNVNYIFRPLTSDLFKAGRHGVHSPIIINLYI
jgi:hypothetical protein